MSLAATVIIKAKRFEKYFNFEEFSFSDNTSQSYAEELAGFISKLHEELDDSRISLIAPVTSRGELGAMTGALMEHRPNLVLQELTLNFEQGFTICEVANDFIWTRTRHVNLLGEG